MILIRKGLVWVRIRVRVCARVRVGVWVRVRVRVIILFLGGGAVRNSFLIFMENVNVTELKRTNLLGFLYIINWVFIVTPRIEL